MKIKRRLLISGVFDLDTATRTSDIPSISIYIYPDNTVNVKIKYGFTEFTMYNEPVSLEMIKDYNTILKIKQDCKSFLKVMLPNYTGKGKITDLYLSGLFHEIMKQVYGFINIGSEVY